MKKLKHKKTGYNRKRAAQKRFRNSDLGKMHVSKIRRETRESLLHGSGAIDRIFGVELLKSRGSSVSRVIDLQQMNVDKIRGMVPHKETTDDEVKRAILDEALVCRWWGVQRDRVIVLGWLGRVLIKVHSPSEILVSFVPGECYEPGDLEVEWSCSWVDFWSSRDALKFLSDYLKERMCLKVPFEMIYDGKIG